jgi:N-methylhydantoinase A
VTSFSIDIDIGGTFTDGFFSDGSTIRTRKVLTTPHDITECFMQCVGAGSEAFGLELGDFLRRSSVARVSTTIGTNLLVQRSGPRIGLIVTKGNRTSLYGKSDAGILGKFIAPEMIEEVDEAVSADGSVEKAVDPEQVLAAVRELVRGGARIIVISFRNAWRNAANEKNARAIIRERYPVHYLRSVPLQIGTDVVHVADDHARTNAAVLNAYVHNDIARRLYRAEDKLREAAFGKPLLVVHATGGNARVAKTVALNTLNSGPAAAVRGAVVIAQLLGLKNVISADMGGTSLDVAIVVDGKLPFGSTAEIEGATVAMPAIELEAVGAGGGSIASVTDGKLRVGPESAGSAPGPACYGKGGMEPTTTDANLLLGFIDPAYFLGGNMKLDAETARRVMERRVGRPLGVSVEEAAQRVRSVVNQEIAAELRSRIGDRDPASFTFLSIGGCGPLHACAVAELAGIRDVVVFPFGSVFSAFGSSTTDVAHTYARTLGIPKSRRAEADTILADFRGQAMRDMAGEGFGEDVVRISSDVRESNGTIDGVQLLAEAAVAHWTPQERPASKTPAAPKGKRTVWWGAAAQETPVFDALVLEPGQTIDGPALVEAPDTVYVIDPAWKLTVDRFGNFVIRKG